MSKLGAIITGASSGVGLAFTKHLLEKGWKVVMIDVNPAGEEIAAQLGSDVLFIKSFEWHPPITFLAANAGISTDLSAPNGIYSPSPAKKLQKPSFCPVDVNIFGTIYCIKLFLDFMQSKDKRLRDQDSKVKGKIVITGSEAGLYKLAADPVYCASKHALVGLVRSLGQPYLENFGITVNSINPGYIPTPLVAPLIPITPIKYATPISTMIRAFDQLMASEESGQILQASGENLYFSHQVPYVDEVSKWVWEDAPVSWANAMSQMGKK